MKTAAHTIKVKSSAGTYHVKCAPGLLRQAQKEISRLGDFSSIHLLTSPRVWKSVGPLLGKSFTKRKEVNVLLFEDTETRKELRSVEEITRKLVRAGADRQSLIVAIGGGVVGDVAGYVAASYLRGVALVQVPTTLVAQVDSAVGGKTGVNLPEGKNLVGAFYPASLVLVDPLALNSLPEREFRGGLAEVIKYGVIADAKLFAFLEKNFDAILERKPAALGHIIRRSLEIKARVVSEDERESGLREILNFGHTFGHALEGVTGYRKYQHGEAIAWGMMCASLLGHELIGTPAEDVSRIVALIRRTGPLPGWPGAEPAELMHWMSSDKKARAGKIRFVLSKKIGQAASYDNASRKLVECVLRCAPHCLQEPLTLVEKCRG